MPQTITPAGIELNPQTEPIQEPSSIHETITNSELTESNQSIINNTEENKY